MRSTILSRSSTRLVLVSEMPATIGTRPAMCASDASMASNCTRSGRNAKPPIEPFAKSPCTPASRRKSIRPLVKVRMCSMLAK